MKIAIVIENFQPTAGGNERSTAQIADRLVRRGHEVWLLTNRAPTRDERGPLHVLSAEGPRTSSARGLLRFSRWASGQIDRGHFDVSLSMTMAVPADVVQPRSGTVRETLRQNLAMRPPGVKRWAKTLTIALNPKQLALLVAERSTLNNPRVRKVIAISRYVVDQLFHHYTIPSRRIELIPNAAEITPIDPDEQARIRRHTRARLCIDDDHVMFLFAATNPQLKGLRPLLQTLAQLVKNHPRAQLVIAGDMHMAWQRLAERLGVRRHVRWIGPTRQMDTLFRATDVTVLPTYYDPASKVVIESLLHGVPAISTAYNGASQWIADPTGHNAWSSPLDHATTASTAAAKQEESAKRPAGRVIESPEDVEALCRAMADLCDDDERRRCAHATTHLDRRLQMDVHVEQLASLLAETAGLRNENQ